MTRILATAVAALVLLPLLGACGADDKKPFLPVPPSSPHVTGPSPTSTIAATPTSTPQVSTAALPLPKGCEILSRDTVRTTMGITAAGSPNDSADRAQCTYQAATSGLVLTAYDFDQSYGTAGELFDRLFTTAGTVQALPGVGDMAKIAIDGSTADVLAMQQLGSHYRFVMLTAFTSGGAIPQWRTVMTKLATEALASMVS